MFLRLPLFLCCLIFSHFCWAEAYYWVDDKGKRHYSDRVPAQESKRERKIIDERGYTVETLPQQQSEEERQAKLAAEAAEKKRREEETRKKTESIAYDTMLLTTYDEVGEIEHARDDRLGLMEGSLQLAIQTHDDNSKRLANLRKEEQALLEKGQPVSDKLRKNINDVINRIKTNELNIKELERQRNETKAKYQRDIDRFNELKSASN